MIQDILLHMDGSGTEAGQRIGAVQQVLDRFGAARVIGLFAQCAPDIQSLSSPPAARVLAPMAAQAEQQLRTALAARPVRLDWVSRPCAHYGAVTEAVQRHARLADLTVLSQPQRGTDNGTLPGNLVEEVVLQAGRPVLVVPGIGLSRPLGERVMVAWNGSREAARALGDALPFLRGARHVEAKVIATPTRDSDDDGPGQAHDPLRALVDHLASHGIRAEAERIVSTDLGVMDMLLSRAEEMSADLIVMGAHGHYGFPRLHRGGGTRYMLSQMTVPILLSH